MLSIDYLLKENRCLLFNSFNLSAFSFLFRCISLFSKQIHIIFIASVHARGSKL